MPTEAQFLADNQGKRFTDVVNDGRVDFRRVLKFFDNPGRQQRMDDAQRRGQPALAGVVQELESLATVDHFFRGEDAHTTMRFRQAVGVIVRMVMEGRGWLRTGQKGYLGQRARVAAGTTTPGAYYNITGPSHWFNRAEHYQSAAAAMGSGSPNSSAGTGGRPQSRNQSDQREYANRLREGFDAIERMGTEAERRETLEYLMNALAATRREEGRPF
jgi:hypothetical protein